MRNPRLLAFDVLRAVDEQDAYANLELARRLREARLDARDAAFATELVSGTLRLRGTYDAVIDQLVDRRLDAGVRDALRLGSHQLLSMRVPTHAAVSTTVEVVKKRIGHRPSGLVNAVLRKVGQRSWGEWTADMALADRYAHPAWVVDLLSEAVGEAEIEALLAADNQPPRVTLVARPGLATREELPGTPTGVSPYAVVLDAGDPGAISAVAEGRAGVQDEGSQLVALALARVAVADDCGRWLDVCAGPGGKAALLAALAAQRGARLLAAERQPHRAGLVRSATTAVGGGLLGVVAADGTRPAWPRDTFDRVLVDAPCTGLGALRRRPEARWRRRPEDLAELVPLQRVLLDRALDCVRPGGVVAYATCSPVLAETAGVVTAALDANPHLVLEDASPLFPTTDHAGPLPGTVQLWPHRHGTDAMFFALIRRR
ncbi:MAG: transcription antitermination factor NusB [Nocardioidaceae bacterium]